MLLVKMRNLSEKARLPHSSCFFFCYIIAVPGIGILVYIIGMYSSSLAGLRGGTLSGGDAGDRIALGQLDGLPPYRVGGPYRVRGLTPGGGLMISREP